MYASPLVTDEIEAGAEFLKHLHAYRPVKAACWLRGEENEERYLYVALEGLTEDNVDIAYGEVLRSTQGMQHHFMDPFRVKLIRTDNPVARAVLDIYRRYPGRIPPRSNGGVFAGKAVTEAYVYPEIRA